MDMSVAKASSDELDAIENLISQAVTAEDTEKKEVALFAAKALALKLLSAYPTDPECWFAAGYTVYYSLDGEKSCDQDIVMYLTECLRLDPNHQFAKLYLGHFYYDKGDFANALSYFQAVDDGYLLSTDTLWRRLNLHELILCCNLHGEASE